MHNDINCWFQTYIKSEPLYLCEEEEQFRAEDINPLFHSVSNNDSLLVPALECPATVHGITAPYFIENGEYTHQNQCRICGKQFSSTHNRNRHERTVHSLEREASKQMTLDEESPMEILPDNSSDISSNVTIEQFAASLQLIQTNPVPAKPISEKQFLEYNRKMCSMLESGKCDFCNSYFPSSKRLLQHLAKKIKIERFSCFFCCISFPNRSQYMKHNLKKYCKQRARMVNNGNCPFKVYQHYECRLCKVLYVHKLLLTRHLVSRHLSDIYPAQCTKCDAIFENVDEHKEHMQGPCYYKIYCSICKATYDTLADFESHTSIHDDNDSSIDIYLKEAVHKPDVESKPVVPVTRFVKRGRKMKKNLKKKGKKGVPTSCPVCPKRYSSYENMIRHFIINHKKHRLHKCHLCTRKFTAEADLQQHIGKTHKKDKHSSIPAANNYSCGQCGDLFPTLDKWCDHQKSHATNNIHQCSECSRVFGSEEELSQHRTEHPNIKLKLYRCSESNSYKAITDYSSNSQSPNPFQCDLCDDSFNTKKQLQKHLNLHKHLANGYTPKPKKNADGYFECTFCDKTYVLSSSLWKHRKVSHGIETSTKKRTCNVCNKVFTTAAAMWEHKKKFHGNQNEQPTVVTREREVRAVRNIKREIYDPDADEVDEKPFRAGMSSHVCDICNKSFPTLKGLSVHAKLHAHREHVAKNERPKCQVCSADFLNVESLLDHMKSHSTKLLKNIFSSIKTEKPQVHFECHVCKKTFQNKAGMVSHMQHRHAEQAATTTDTADINEQTNFKCTVCKISLMNGISLANHMRIHLRNGTSMLHNCTLCQVKVTNASSLKNHYKVAHNLDNKMATKIVTEKSNSLVENNEEGFECKACSKTFMREHLLDAHMKSYHNTESKLPKKYKCAKCSKFLPTATAYEKHVKQFHNHLLCVECDKFFETNAALCSHKGWHNRRVQMNNLTCVTCDKQFQRKSDYVRHMRLHKKPVKCKYCPRVFLYKKPLKKHLSFHSAEFTSNNVLTENSEPVTNPFADNASKNMKTTTVLRSFHVKSEVKSEPGIVWPYKCTECHTGFVNAKKLRLHILSSHSPHANI